MQFAYLKHTRVSAFDCNLRNRDLKKQGKDVYRCKKGKEVILKKGLKKIPHFAHKSDCICDLWGESESDAHYYMKIWLQQFLHIPEEMVEYDELDGVRPDLLWKKKVAIEIQHSPMSIEEYERRNQIYANNSLSPLWIFHQREIIPFPLSKLNGKYGKIHNPEERLFRLNALEQYIYDREESLFYFSYPDKAIFNFPIERITTTGNQAMFLPPCVTYAIFHRVNDKTLFKMQREIDLTTPQVFEQCSQTRFLTEMHQFIDANEVILYLKMRNAYNDKPVYGNIGIQRPEIMIEGGHIISLKIDQLPYENLIQDLGTFSMLHTLELRNCNLISFPKLKGLVNLQKINLEGNRIADLARLKVKCPLLADLNLTNNQISAVDGEIFEIFPHLHTLNLTKNRIATLPQSITSLVSLKTLILNQNKLKSIKYLPQNLRDLAVNDNQITSIPDIFEPLKDLQRMLMAGNKITCISVIPPHIILFDISRNPIETVPFEIESSPLFANIILPKNLIEKTRQEKDNSSEKAHAELQTPKREKKSIKETRSTFAMKNNHNKRRHPFYKIPVPYNHNGAFPVCPLCQKYVYNPGHYKICKPCIHEWNSFVKDGTEISAKLRSFMSQSENLNDRLSLKFLKLCPFCKQKYMAHYRTSCKGCVPIMVKEEKGDEAEDKVETLLLDARAHAPYGKEEEKYYHAMKKIVEMDLTFEQKLALINRLEKRF